MHLGFMKDRWQRKRKENGLQSRLKAIVGGVLKVLHILFKLIIIPASLTGSYMFRHGITKAKLKSGFKS